MASYQQGNDYQTYQTNPYQLPTQQIIAAIQTRNNYWESGASNLKSAYQNYLGLDLSRGDNHERLNQLMQGVNQNLEKVTKTDLSLGENYGEAMKIFDPITKDDNIMGDNYLTKHYKQEFSTAQTFRTKDNGKEYSETNVRDLGNHLRDFVNDPNASNWRSHYASRAFYTPYTDVAAEIRQLGKDFKPDTTLLSSPMYLDKDGHPTNKGGNASDYLLTTNDKSIVASQYRAFIDAHLSDKAKNQLAIDGRVKYYDNPQALIGDYSNHNQEKIDTYNRQIKELEGKAAGATDGDKEQYISQINNYKAAVSDLTKENTKIKAGDYSNIIPYKNQIAASIYTGNYMDYLSKASAQKNIEVKYTPDQVWKTMYQESNENARFNIAKETQWGIASMNDKTRRDIATFTNDTKLMIAGMKGTNGQPLTGIPAYDIADKSNDEQFGVSKYNELQSTSQKDFQGAVDQLNRQVKDYTKGKIDPNDNSTPIETRNGAVQSFFADPRNKAAIDQYKAAAAKKGSDDQLFKGVDDYIKGELSSKYPEIYNYKQTIINKIGTGETVRLEDRNTGQIVNLNLSKEDIKNALSSKSGVIQIGKAKDPVSLDPLGGNYQSERNIITYNGKNYNIDRSNVLGLALRDLSKASGDYESKRADLLNQNITRIAGIEKLYQDDKNPYYKAAHQITMREIAGSDSVIKPEDVLLTDKDRNGNVYFKVQGDAHLNIDKIKARVIAQGGKYIEADDKFILPGSKYGALTGGQSFQDPKLSSIKTFIDFRSSTTPNDIVNTAPQQWGNRNFQFKVNIENGHPSYSIIDPYSGAIFGSDENGSPFNTLESAASAATYLGNMSQDNFDNKIRVVGGIPTWKVNK